MRNIPLLKYGLIISGLILVFLVLRNRVPFGKANSGFAVNEGREITKIEFSSGEKKVLLSLNEGKWLLNGSAEARKSGVNFTLRILNEIKIKSPVSPALFHSEITAKGIIPVKVKVYSGSRILNTFLVYKTGSNSYGNIMKKNEGAKPFIVSIPGYEGEIGSFFSVNPLFWKPFTVFSHLPSEIGGIKFDNISDPSSSFSISNNKMKFSVVDATGKGVNADQEKIGRYISYFAMVPFETWAFDMKDDERQKLSVQKPFAIITVFKSSGGSETLTLWERFPSGGNSGSPDTDRLYGRIGMEGDYFIVRYFDIDPLLKKLSYFTGE